MTDEERELRRWCVEQAIYIAKNRGYGLEAGTMEIIGVAQNLFEYIIAQKA
jgi:hypothetical protein